MLIARGPGLVVLMAMLRHRAARSSTVEARLLLSARSPEDVLYHDELAALEASGALSVYCTFAGDPASSRTQLAVGLSTGPLATAGSPSSRRPRIFVCGPAPFIGAVAGLLADVGGDRRAVRAQDSAPAGDNCGCFPRARCDRAARERCRANRRGPRLTYAQLHGWRGAGVLR
jgi:ferredoxin-NADP reductase